MAVRLRALKLVPFGKKEKANWMMASLDADVQNVTGEASKRCRFKYLFSKQSILF